jgi:hypothetical protein
VQCTARFKAARALIQTNELNIDISQSDSLVVVYLQVNEITKPNANNKGGVECNDPPYM